MYDDVPREVFAHYRELEKIGLAAPQVTYIMHALKERGMDVDTDAITIEEGFKSICKAFWQITKGTADVKRYNNRTILSDRLGYTQARPAR